MSTATLTATQIRQEIWWSRFGSALRTVVACTIVGCSTLYGPEKLQKLAAFSAYSFVTAILIVSEASLGDVLRGFCLAIYATIQMMVPSVLCLWLVGPGRFSIGLSAVAVAVIAFLVALPESTDLLAKRIAFGQIVIVFVSVVVKGKETGVVMLPIQVASSTALGAFASFLALLLPYPKLACHEVKKMCTLYLENIHERLNLLVTAFTTQNKITANDLISDARSLSELGTKQLPSVTDKQKGMLWERPQMRFMKKKYIDLEDKLQELEVPIKGMEMALTSCPSFPVGMVDQELREDLQSYKMQIELKLQQAKRDVSSEATPCITKPSWNPKTTVSSVEDFPAFFFLYCLQLLRNGLPKSSITNGSKTEESSDLGSDGESLTRRVWGSVLLNVLPSREGLVFALKCSLSLGLAVLLGLIYNKQRGYWSGLSIAISFSNRRQATFATANARVQGTAMGSLYGIICSSMFRKAVEFRFLPLLPWLIFTSFLRHSRMYGDAGGFSAAVGASLILGRTNYGTPWGFGIARLTEATIGLTCMVVIEILFQPTRAATLTKNQLSKSLGVLRNCTGSIQLCTDQKIMINLKALRDKQKTLKSHIKVLDGFIGEAEMEPNFWFLPFQGTRYRKILDSLSRMADLLLLVAYKIEFLSQVSVKFGVGWKSIQDQINVDLELFREKVGGKLKCLEATTMIDMLEMQKQDLQNKNISQDIELGRSPTEDVQHNLGLGEEDIEEILSSFLQFSGKIANININEEQNLKSQTIICLNGLGFSISNLIKETKKIEKEIKELVKWINSTDNILVGNFL